VPRAVVDPNVLISGLITPHGVSARILLELRDGAFELVISPLLVAELDGVLRRPKFRAYVTLDDVQTFVESIRGTAELVDDPEPADEALSQDPADEYLVALARAARVDALVSGDPHLTRLRARIPVRTPREFLDSLSGT
jgi:putative PIN family toxin of toxin-antitoxin system